jgi:hypothetical protein
MARSVLRRGTARGFWFERNAAAVGAAVVAVCAFGVSAIARAQTADPAERFLGIWSGVFTTQDHDHWQIEDFVCFPGCPSGVRARMTALLDDPANDSLPVDALMGQAIAYAAEHLAAVLTPLGMAIQQANDAPDDPKLRCEPYGFVREVTNPLPLQIRRDGQNLVIRYEEWSLLRIIHLDGRERPSNATHTLLGHSVGRIENGELVVETSGINPGWISDFSRGGHSGALTATERYRVVDSPRRLELELTLRDPEVLTAPYVIEKTWLYTPEVEIVQDRCGELPGKF